MDSVLESLKSINRLLADNFFCLPLPQYLNAQNIDDMSKLETCDAIVSKVVTHSMSPDQRTMQYISRYQHVEAFRNIDQFILSALKCYFLQEYEASQLAATLCVESILWQWLSPKRNGKHAENFNIGRDWKTNLRASWDELLFQSSLTEHRQMLLTEYKDNVDKMICKFYRNTNDKLSGFNRHEAAHFLHDVEIGVDNIARIFLLLDIVCELIYLEENGYNNISNYTYFDSAIEKVLPELNKKRQEKYRKLINVLMQCDRCGFYLKKHERFS